MTDQELAEKSQKELVRIAKRLVKEGHFRLYIAGDESKDFLIKAIKDMSLQEGGRKS
jgi:hypothetical protein